MTDPHLQIRGGEGRSSKPWDKGWARSPKKYFWPFRPQFGLNISWASLSPGSTPGHYTQQKRPLAMWPYDFSSKAKKRKKKCKFALIHSSNCFGESQPLLMEQLTILPDYSCFIFDPFYNGFLTIIFIWLLRHELEEARHRRASIWFGRPRTSVQSNWKFTTGIRTWVPQTSRR